MAYLAGRRPRLLASCRSDCVTLLTNKAGGIQKKSLKDEWLLMAASQDGTCPSLSSSQRLVLVPYACARRASRGLKRAAAAAAALSVLDGA